MTLNTIISRLLILTPCWLLPQLVSGQSVSYVRVSSTYPAYFETTDQQTFIPVGLNLCWPRFIDNEAEGLAKMEFYFKELQRNGGNYARIWLSAPFWEIEPDRAGVYSGQKLDRLDKLMTLAQRYGIRLKLCLENFRQLTDSPPKFAGSVPFDRPIYHVSRGGPLTDMNEYLQGDAGKRLFRQRAQALARRLAANPNVFGWELWNEMDAVKATGWESWTNTMLEECQGLFPNHLVMQSLGSYDSEQKRGMYYRMASLPANDVAQVHRYLDEGARWAICQAPMDQLASQGAVDLLSAKANKPLLVAEIGAVEPNHAGPWKLYPKDTAGVVLHDLLFAPFFAGAAGPGHAWHWDSYVEKNNLWWHFGRFAEAIKGFDPVTQRTVAFQEQLPDQLSVYGLRGTRQILLWIRDGATTWQTELVNSQPARTVRGAALPLTSSPVKRVQFYNPWTNQWTNGQSSGKAIMLPDFTRSVVVKLDLQ